MVVCLFFGGVLAVFWRFVGVFLVFLFVCFVFFVVFSVVFWCFLVSFNGLLCFLPCGLEVFLVFVMFYMVFSWLSLSFFLGVV